MTDAESEKRISDLEWLVKNLTAELKKSNESHEKLKSNFKETDKKINRAEAWGRGFIYAALGVVGFISQFEKITAWLKKLA